MVSKLSGGKLKAFLVVLLGALFAFTMAGCSAQQEDPSPSDGSQGSANEAEAESAPLEIGNALVVYYSATGDTGEIAQFIADDTGAALFPVLPVDAYTPEDLDYNDVNSRVYREHTDESIRGTDQSTTVPDWDSYDTVFIGYPIWWGGAAWPINDFVEANDFTGKTVIPYCSSMTSGIGQSAKDLAVLAGTGDWLPGTRFSRTATAEDVQEWLDDL